MEMLPLVSVVIGTYNRESYIQSTLDSVFDQTYQNLEVIVVDDASTDGTVEALRSYGDRIRLVSLEKNSGLPAVPRNVGAQQAKGDFLAFLDSDDLWLPEKIEKQVKAMKAQPDWGLCHTVTQVIDHEGKPLRIRHEGNFPSYECNLLEALFEHCFITLSSCIIRTDIYWSFGGFNEDSIWKAGEDLELFIRLAKHHGVGAVNEILTQYRIDNRSISRLDDAWKNIPRDMQFKMQLIQDPQNLNECVTKHPQNKVIKNVSRQGGVYWRDRGYTSRSLWFLGHGLLHAPFSSVLYMEVVKTLGRGLLKSCFGVRGQGGRVAREEDSEAGDRREL